MSELLEAATLHTKALEGLSKAMDIFISGDKAIVTRPKHISVDYRPSYSVGSIVDGELFWIYRDDPGWRPF